MIVLMELTLEKKIILVNLILYIASMKKKQTIIYKQTKKDIYCFCFVLHEKHSYSSYVGLLWVIIFFLIWSIKCKYIPKTKTQDQWSGKPCAN